MAVPKFTHDWSGDHMDSLIKPDEIRALMKAYTDGSSEKTSRDVFEREYMTWPEYRVGGAIPSDPVAFKGAADAFITAGDALKRSFGTIATSSVASGIGTTGSGLGPVTMKEIEAAMDRVRKKDERDIGHTLRESIMAISGTDRELGDPTGWKMTSARWLTENHPEYMSRRGVAAHDKLRGALASMGYCEAEASLSDGSMRKDVAIKLRGDLLTKWDQAEHEAMVAYLAEGGLSARMKKIRPDAATWESIQPAAEPKPEWPSAMAATKPYIEQDLDQVVEELSNPTNGSW